MGKQHSAADDGGFRPHDRAYAMVRRCQEIYAGWRSATVPQQREYARMYQAACAELFQLLEPDIRALVAERFGWPFDPSTVVYDEVISSITLNVFGQIIGAVPGLSLADGAADLHQRLLVLVERALFS